MTSKWLSLLTVTTGLLSTAAHAQAVCSQCGQAACATQPATVTDWKTNERHEVGCVRCALDMMATRFPWSRASFAAPDHPDAVTVTRAQGRWSTKPEGAVIVVAAAGEACGAVRAFASREGFAEYARRHPREVAASNKPVSLAAYVRKLASAVTPKAQARPVTDAPAATPVAHALPSGHPDWVASAVGRVRATGLMNGDPNGAFRGRETITRYELAQTVSRVLDRLGGPGGGAARGEHGGHLVTQAAEGGKPTRAELLVQPQPDPSGLVLAVAGELTEQGMSAEAVRQAVALVPAAAESAARTVQLTPPQGRRAPDVPPDHWAHDAVNQVLGAGLMEGYPDGTFHGEGEVTRYEIAMVLSRMIDRHPVLAQAPAKAAANKWTCPMHPEVISDKPGECPKCGMDLRREEAPSKGGAAARQYTCPMHPEVVSDKPGECPKCGMDLVEKTPAEKAGESPPPTGESPAAPPEAPTDVSKLRELAKFLEQDMRAAGLSDEQIARALAPVKAEIEARGRGAATDAAAQKQLAALARARQTLAQLEAELAATETAGVSDRQAPKEAVGQSKISIRQASEDKALPFKPEEWRDQTTLLGPTGLVLAPTADLQPLGQVQAGFGRFRGNNVTFGTAGLTDQLEVGASLTAGALPSRLVPHAKYQVWNSETFDARLSVGLIDPLDDLDTTFYGVFTKDFSLKLGASRPRLVSLSAGLGGGMLLDGFFGGVNVPINEKLSLQTEVVDFGGDSLWNAGLDYEILSDLRAKVASVDGHLSGGVAYETSF